MPKDTWDPPSAERMLTRLLARDAKERRRLSYEFACAGEVQTALLSRELPQVEGYEFFGVTVRRHDISRDYYEVIPRRDGEEVVALLAEVSGASLSASLLTGYLEALLSISIERGLAPHEILEAVSGPFFRKTPDDTFSTMILAALEVSNGRLALANAGHPPGFIVHWTGEVGWCQPTGAPVGLLARSRYSYEECSLSPGDVLVLYSDGLSSSANRDQVSFGSDRIADVVTRHRRSRLSTIATRIDCTIAEFCAGSGLTDDRSVLLVRRNE